MKVSAVKCQILNWIRIKLVDKGENILIKFRLNQYFFCLKFISRFILYLTV